MKKKEHRNNSDNTAGNNITLAGVVGFIILQMSDWAVVSYPFVINAENEYYTLFGFNGMMKSIRYFSEFPFINVISLILPVLSVIAIASLITSLCLRKPKLNAAFAYGGFSLFACVTMIYLVCVSYLESQLTTGHIAVGISRFYPSASLLLAIILLLLYYVLGEKKGTKRSTRELTQMSMLAAISVVLVYFIRFPIFPAYGFLEYDPADITLIIGAFLFGPAAGLVLTAVVSVIQGLTVSASGGPIGIIMHFMSTGSMILTAGFLFRRGRSLKVAGLALAVGVAVLCVVMVIWNIILTPVFMGVPRQAVIDIIIPVILPFNIIKAGANAVIAFFLYRMIGKHLRRMIEVN